MTGDDVGRFFRFVMFMLLAGGWWYLARMLPASLREHREDALSAKMGFADLGAKLKRTGGMSILDLKVLVVILLVYALFIYGGLFHSRWLAWLAGPYDPD